jgi:hypothetical protein
MLGIFLKSHPLTGINALATLIAAAKFLTIHTGRTAV